MWLLEYNSNSNKVILVLAFPCKVKVSVDPPGGFRRFEAEKLLKLTVGYRK